MRSSRHKPAIEIFQAFLTSNWRLVSLAATTVLLSSASGIAAPYLFSRLVDRLTRETVATHLLWGFVAYAVLIGLASALQRAVQYISVIASENLGFVVSTLFFGRIVKKQPDFFVEHNPAEIQAAGAQGRAALTTIMNIALISFLPGTAQIGLTLVMLGAMLNFEIVAIVAAYGAAAITLTIASVGRSQVLLDAAFSAGQASARLVGNAMNAMETLRYLGSHRWMIGRFNQKAQAVKDCWRAYLLCRATTSALLGLGLSMQFAVNFMFLLPSYQAGETTIGNIVLFNSLLLQLNLPFDMIAQAMDNCARSRAQLVPLAQMWQAPEDNDYLSVQAFVPKKGCLAFNKVRYCYNNGRGVENVSFVASRGAVTFIIGGTGSGKSTIFKLALKSIAPQAGRILVDELDITQISRGAWYTTVAVVPQDVVLLNESLADNIMIGRVRDEARLRDVAEKAAILSFIDGLPERFEAKVGERGVKLSGGERQRIAIARALYGNPTILLLDEASSALDEATERDIMQHIRNLARDVTVLAITHRRSVISDADQVVDLSPTGARATTIKA